MNDVHSLLKSFCDFERKENAFGRKIFTNVYYWDPIRQYFYETLLEHYKLFSYDPLLSGKKWGWKEKLTFFKELVKNEVNFIKAKKKKKVLFACISRNMDKSGFATDGLIENYRASLKSEDYFQIELFNNLVFDPETKFENRYFSHLMWFLQKFNFLVIPFFRKEVNDLVDKFEKHFDGVSIKRKAVYQLIALHIMEIWFFKRALRKAKPKIVIGSLWMTGLAKACNELGIDFVEIQHGSFSGNYNLMYDYPEEVKFTRNSSFPKYFFTLGEYWNGITYTPARKLSMGNNYVYTPFRPRAGECYNSILIISCKDYTPIFIPMIRTCAARLPDKTFYFKLHSSEYEYIDAVKKEFESFRNVQVIYNEKTSNELLHVSDIMFTIHSTVLYQALQLGVKAIILKKKYYWISEDALNLENVYLVQNEEELIGRMEKIYAEGSFGVAPKKEFFKAFDQQAFFKFLDQYN